MKRRLGRTLCRAVHVVVVVVAGLAPSPSPLQPPPLPPRPLGGKGLPFELGCLLSTGGGFIFASFGCASFGTELGGEVVPLLDEGRVIISAPVRGEERVWLVEVPEAGRLPRLDSRDTGVPSQAGGSALRVMKSWFSWHVDYSILVVFSCYCQPCRAHSSKTEMVMGDELLMGTPVHHPNQVHNTGPRFLLGDGPWLPGHLHVEPYLLTTATTTRLRVLPDNAGVYRM